MTFNDKACNDSIDKFLNLANSRDVLSLEERLSVLGLLSEPEPPDTAIWKEISSQKKKFVSWLGVHRRTVGEGEAGKIDTLLMAINGFVVLFSIAALLPVFVIYWNKTWIIPVLLLCPGIHFLAHRLAGNPDVDRATVKNLHLFAAIFSIVPLACLASYVAPYLGQALRARELAGMAAAAWAVYTVVVSLLTRTERAFYWSLFIVGGVLNLALFWGLRDYPGQVCLNICIGTLLLVLAGKSRSGKPAMSPGRLYMTAVVFMGLAFLFLLLIILTDGLRINPDVVGFAPYLYVPAVAMLPVVMKFETLRLGGDKLKNVYFAMLGVTWLYFGAVLLIFGTSGILRVSHAARVMLASRLSPILMLLLLFAWSLWFLYEQFMAEKEFDVNLFNAASFLMLACLIAGYFLLATRVGFVAALILAIACYVVVQKLRDRHAPIMRELKAEETVKNS